jgi:hypothetical protein
MSNKPYFSPSVVDKIVSIVLSEVESEGNAVDEKAIRSYVVAPKTVYENTILEGVAEGIYLATIKEDAFAYKPKPATDDEAEEILQAAVAKSDAAKTKDKLVPKVFPDFKANAKAKHKARINAKRALSEKQREAAFERGKQVPTIDKIKETIVYERSARLSHALVWCKQSPKLGTTATKKETDEQPIPLPV